MRINYFIWCWFYLLSTIKLWWQIIRLEYQQTRAISLYWKAYCFIGFGPDLGESVTKFLGGCCQCSRPIFSIVSSTGRRIGLCRAECKLSRGNNSFLRAGIVRNRLATSLSTPQTRTLKVTHSYFNWYPSAFSIHKTISTERISFNDSSRNNNNSGRAS